MFTWKPKLGKNHGSPHTPNCPLCDESYNEGVGGNDLTLYLFANRLLQQNDVLYLTLSHSLHIHALYTKIITTTHATTTFLFLP